MGSKPETIRNYQEDVYELELELTEDIYQQTGKKLHDAIPVAIMEQLLEGNERVQDIFSIRKPCRLLNEGYEFENGIVAEDFAISGSYNGGEMIVGQSVSSDSKEVYGGKPRDFIQAEYFQRQLSKDKDISPTNKKAFSIRTKIPCEDVKSEEEKIEGILENEGRYELPVVIHEIDVTTPEFLWPSD